MSINKWVPAEVESLLDVGCNVGASLEVFYKRNPKTRLSGLDFNQDAVEQARKRVPSAEIQCASAAAIPFQDESFDLVTCFEVLEHIPASERAKVFEEIRRVLRPKGRLIMSTPHRGWFEFLDSINLRFRFPLLYRLVPRGGGDVIYAKMGRTVKWHYHFTKAELLALAGSNWNILGAEGRGLLIVPIMDILSWPFYRLGRPDHPIRRAFERLSVWDHEINYGSASYGIIIVLEKPEKPALAPASPLAEIEGYRQ